MPAAQLGQPIHAGLSSSGTIIIRQHSVHEPQDFSAVTG
jgi:hypothetical protein